jgi:hypothetical protein
MEIHEGLAYYGNFERVWSDLGGGGTRAGSDAFKTLSDEAHG